MSKVAESSSPPLMVATRAVIFVALLTGNLFPALGPVSVATAAAIIAAPLVMWEIIRALPKIHPALPVAALVFGVLIAVGLLNPPFLPYGDEKFGKILTSTLLSALAATLIRDRRHIRALAWVWLTAACVLAVATLAGGGGDRATTFDSNPIWLGRELVSGILVAVWLWWRGHLRPVLAFILIMLIVVALGATESRGPLLGATIALSLYVLLVRPRLPEWGWAMVSFAAAGVIAVLYFMPHVIPERFLELYLDTGSSIDDSRRDEMWADTLPIIRDNPGGIGYGNWQTYTLDKGLYPHNLFLETFAEAGWLPGMVLIGTTLGVLVALARRCRTSPEAALVFVLLVASTVEVSVSGDLGARSFFALLVLGALVARWGRSGQTSAGEARNSPRELDRCTHSTVPST